MEMSKKELIEHARAIKDFCTKCNGCDDCPFSYDLWNGCKLTALHDYPMHWDLHAKVNEECQYAVFDYTREKCSAAFSDLEMAERVRELLYTFACNEGRTLIIKKRLLMEWEQVKDKEEEEREGCEGE